MKNGKKTSRSDAERAERVARQPTRRHKTAPRHLRDVTARQIGSGEQDRDNDGTASASRYRQRAVFAIASRGCHGVRRRRMRAGDPPERKNIIVLVYSQPRCSMVREKGRDDASTAIHPSESPAHLHQHTLNSKQSEIPTSPLPSPGSMKKAPDSQNTKQNIMVYCRGCRRRLPFFQRETRRCCRFARHSGFAR